MVNNINRVSKFEKFSEFDEVWFGRGGRFNAEIALKKLRGKRMMFVGDSLQRGQWQSFVCMVEWLIPEDKKSIKRGRFLSVFSAKVLSFCSVFLILKKTEQYFAHNVMSLIG